MVTQAPAAGAGERPHTARSRPMGARQTETILASAMPSFAHGIDAPGKVLLAGAWDTSTKQAPWCKLRHTCRRKPP